MINPQELRIGNRIQYIGKNQSYEVTVSGFRTNMIHVETQNNDFHARPHEFIPINLELQHILNAGFLETSKNRFSIYINQMFCEIELISTSSNFPLPGFGSKKGFSINFHKSPNISPRIYIDNLHSLQNKIFEFFNHEIKFNEKPTIQTTF